MGTISHCAELKRLLVLGSVYWLALGAFARPIAFEHVVIDQDAIGHREVGDVDGDGFNDIVAVNYPMLVWYEYPNWERHLVADISKFADCKTYRSCDMELGDIDGDGDLDIAAGKENAKVHTVIWYENPGTDRGGWSGRLLSETAFAPDRIVIAEVISRS